MNQIITIKNLLDEILIGEILENTSSKSEITDYQFHPDEKDSDLILLTVHMNNIENMLGDLKSTSIHTFNFCRSSSLTARYFSFGIFLNTKNDNLINPSQMIESFFLDKIISFDHDSDDKKIYTGYAKRIGFRWYPTNMFCMEVQLVNIENTHAAYYALGLNTEIKILDPIFNIEEILNENI